MATQSSSPELEAEVDRLYQLPLEGFVLARNTLSARLMAGGDKDGAARVKGLARPSVAAWAANQVYWQARREFDALLASVERLQGAQVPGAPGGASLRDAMKARRETQDRVLRSATSLLASAGYAASPATLLKVKNTLEALAAGGAAEAHPGRLAQELEPPGFEALAARAVADVPRASPPGIVRPAETSPRLAPPAPRDEAAGEAPPELVERVEARAAEQERLRAALAESEKRLDRARRESREAAGAHSVAQKRAEAARAEQGEAARRLERAEERVGLTAEDEAQKAREAERLASSRETAEAERDAALRALRASE